MSNIKIAIQSYKRSDKVITLDSIPLSYKDNVYLFVRREEYDLYYNNYGQRCNVVPLDNVQYLSDTRTAIINYFGNDRIWLTDDDNKIHTARYIEEKDIIKPNTKEIVTEDQFYDCLSYMDEMMDLGYTHGLLRLSLFARGNKYWPHRVNCYGFTNTFLDLSKIDKSDLPYNDVQIMSDLYVFLYLLKKGYDNCMISKYMVTSGPANSQGGCSTYRNVENYNRCAEKIAQTFPEYVKIKDKSRYNSNITQEDLQLKGLIVRIPKKK
jgi:hypothetical protein